MKRKLVDISSPEFRQAVLDTVAQSQAPHKVGDLVVIQMAWYNHDRIHNGRRGVVQGVTVSGGTAVYSVQIGEKAVVTASVRPYPDVVVGGTITPGPVR